VLVGFERCKNRLCLLTEPAVICALVKLRAKPNWSDIITDSHRLPYDPSKHRNYLPKYTAQRSKWRDNSHKFGNVNRTKQAL
jgi:hypothetical protein